MITFLLRAKASSATNTYGIETFVLGSTPSCGINSFVSSFLKKDVYEVRHHR